MNDLALEDVYVYLLERTIREIKRDFNRRLKAAFPGLTITSDQWVILKRISERESLNQREVAAVTGKDPASITRTLDLLAKKNWVERQDVPGDRRAYQVVLTAEGQELVEQLIPLAQATREAGLANVTAEEFESLKTVLNKIYSNVS
ncbi:MAG: MarR family transcriptional regulator [Cyanobacteria bacterium J06576_12]